MSRIAENVTRLFGRVRPTVGLRTCLATLALFSVVVWYFSPAKPSPLPPRGQVERVTVLRGVNLGLAGEIASELSPEQVERLYLALRDAELTQYEFPKNEFVILLRVTSGSGSRQLVIWAHSEMGALIEVYGEGAEEYAIFRTKADAESYRALLDIGATAIETHRRSKAASN